MREGQRQRRQKRGRDKHSHGCRDQLSGGRLPRPPANKLPQRIRRQTKNEVIVKRDPQEKYRSEENRRPCAVVASARPYPQSQSRQHEKDGVRPRLVTVVRQERTGEDRESNQSMQ